MFFLYGFFLADIYWPPSNRNLFYERLLSSARHCTFFAFRCNDASLWILAIDDDCWSYEMIYMYIEVIVHIEITYASGRFSADTPTINLFA